MAELTHHQQISVWQHDSYGCIPAGVEWLLRYCGINVGDSLQFQLKHDQRYQGRDNNFKNVKQSAEVDYPYARFSVEVYDLPQTGKDKLLRVENLIDDDIPALISVQLSYQKDGRIGFHIVPVVKIDDETVTVSNWEGKPELKSFPRQDLIDRHDHYSGHDILFIKTCNRP